MFIECGDSSNGCWSSRFKRNEILYNNDSYCLLKCGNLTYKLDKYRKTITNYHIDYPFELICKKESVDFIKCYKDFQDIKIGEIFRHASQEDKPIFYQKISEYKAEIISNGDIRERDCCTFASPLITVKLEKVTTTKYEDEIFNGE